jgi:hypothetical protein
MHNALILVAKMHETPFVFMLQAQYLSAPHP